MSNPAVSKRRIFALASCMVAILAVALLVLAPINHRTAHAGSSVGLTSQPLASQSKTVTPAAREHLQATFAALPLAFEQNQGQTDAQVKYMARGSGYTLYLTKQEAVFAFHSKSSGSGLAARRRMPSSTATKAAAQEKPESVIRMQLVGGNSAAQIAAADQLPGKTNYYLGNDPTKWHTNVPQYSRVAYKSVYPGIDLAYYGEQSRLEFDFIVAPESNPAPIDLAFSGAQHVATDGSGNLIVSSAAGDVVLHKPVAYQQRNGVRQPVDVRFVLNANNQVSFELGSYDRSRELVIDPSVTYSTYLGGTAEDDGYAIGFDGSGNAYVAGQTASTDFPTVGGITPNTNAGGFDVFVTKIAASGSSLIYSTYVGGSGDDSGNALAVDSLGDVFVAGGTTSSNFPAVNAFQTGLTGNPNAFVFELKSDGTALLYSTYLGGTGADVAVGIAVDSSGAYVVGSTSSVDFPTLNAYQPSIAGSNNGFVTKINAANSGASSLVYSTYLGVGTGDFASAVAIPLGSTTGPNSAYVTGATPNATFPTTPKALQTTCGSCSGGLPDAFVTVFSTDGKSLVYSTFLGGSGQDQGLGVAVDSTGDAYVTGLTRSSDFPLQSASQKTLGGSQNAFVAQLNPGGTAAVYSTYLGGEVSDAGTSVAVDLGKNAYVTGQTSSTKFPTVNATQATIGGGNDAFVSEINVAGSLIFSTYLGGSLNENTNASGGQLAALGAIAVDGPGANVYVVGNTLSTDFPTTAPEQKSEAGGIDAFVAKYAFPTSPDFTISAPSTTTPASVAPGSSGTAVVTLTEINGYNSSVNLTCAVTGTGSPLPACGSFAPASPVTPTAAGAQTTLTITTTGASAAMAGHSKFFYAMWLPIAGMALVGMGFSSSRTRRKKFLGFLMVGMVMAALLLMPACGGGSSNNGGGGGGGGCTTCTPAGNYTVTITGTGTDASATTHATTVTLTVN
ncbi:MAG TPA: SBBP repeat-containing protein [Candidatus Sulfotelmatobacter sp.]|nr:SBBP repeat-containing protein [Candidatus Sulfotelmatobacter sp.]